MKLIGRYPYAPIQVILMGRSDEHLAEHWPGMYTGLQCLGQRALEAAGHPWLLV